MKHEGAGTRCWPIEGDEKFSFILDKQRVFPAGQVCRRSLSLNGQDSEQSAVDMKGMRHPDRCDLPHLYCPQLRLDIDAADIKRLAVYPYERSHVGVATRPGRVAHRPLLRTSCRRCTAEAGLTGAGSIKCVGNSLMAGLAAVGSNRITGT